MKVRLCNHVYIRHGVDESIVICPRTGACEVVRHGKPFLEQIGFDWREVKEIVTAIAKQFGCEAKEVFDDAWEIFGDLERQGFIECDNLTGYVETNVAVVGDSSSHEEDVAFPLSDFYKRHNLIAELHMDLTDGCNESCVHCYIPKGRSTYLPTSTAIQILREFREMQGLTVYLSGGECLLHPGFAEIAREAKRLGLNVIVMTNLSLCDAKKVELLKEIDPQFVNVSLYSMKATEHDAITRVSGSWEKTMWAIRKLKEAGVHIRLAAPLMRENKDAASGLLDFAEKENMHCILGCDIIGRTDHNCSNQSHALSVDEIVGVIRRHKRQLCHSELSNEWCAPDTKVCDIGEGKLNINAHGDYYPCDGFHGMVLGSAKHDKLSDVWHCEKLNRLRALRNRDFKSCVGCQNRPWCKVCLMRNFNETGDMMTPDPLRCALSAVHRIIWKER